MAFEFLDRLLGPTQPNPPSQPVKENWHEDFIIHIASVLRPQVYVELGLYRCELFNRVIPYAEQLIGVDTEEIAGKHMLQSPKARFFHGTTDALAEELKAKPLAINMLFIDADHSKESVKRDFDNFFPFVAPHGLILMHDGHPKDKQHMDKGYCGDGYLAIEELSKKAGKDYELVTIPIHPGVTICRKRTNQLSWQEK